MECPSEKLQKLQKIIKEADGYVPITPEYNYSISSALKNTLDYFLEEYFFKHRPSYLILQSLLVALLQEIIFVKYQQRWVHLQFHHNFQSTRFTKHLMLMENYLTKIMRDDSQNSQMSLNGMCPHWQNRENLGCLIDYAKSLVFGITLKIFTV